MQRKRLGEILLGARLIDETKLQQAIAEQRRVGGRLGRVFLDLGFITEDALLKALSEQFQVPLVDVSAVEIPREVLDLVPARLAREHNVLPVKREASFLFLAMSDPSDVGVADEVRVHARKLVVQPCVAGEKALAAAVARFYPEGGAAPDPLAPAARRRSRKSIFGIAPQFSSLDVRIEVAEKEIQKLQEKIEHADQIRHRDEEIIRQLCLLLIEKKVATREEILKRINRTV